MQQQQAFFFDVYRSAVRAVADLVQSSLENAQRIQSQQLDGLRNAMEENVKSTRQVSEVNSMAELMALQARAAGTQVEHAFDYWNRLWQSAADTQIALIGQAQSQLGRIGEQVREGYALTARAGDEASRFTASRVANITGDEHKEERKSA
jgi:phasin family protein